MDTPPWLPGHGLSEPVIIVRVKAVRLSLAFLVLGALAYLGFMLVPVYAANWRLQRYIQELAESPAVSGLASDLVRVRVAQHAGALGLPVNASQIRVTRGNSGVAIDARYAIRIDLPIYTVDLHMRASSGVR